MRFARVRSIVGTTVVAVSIGGVVACEHDTNPYGPAYRTVHRTIVGVYRPLELLQRAVPQLPDDFEPLPPGSDVRLVFGSIQNLTSRVRLTGLGPGGSDLETRLYGSWDYDVTRRRITLRLDPGETTGAIETVLQVTLLDRWVRIQGVVDIRGHLVPLDLGKSLVEDDGTAGGGPAAASRGAR